MEARERGPSALTVRRKKSWGEIKVDEAEHEAGSQRQVRQKDDEDKARAILYSG